MSNPEFYGLVEKTLKVSFVILIISSLLLSLDPPNPLILGFVAGLGVSIVSVFFLALRIDRMMAIMSIDHRKAGLFMNLGHATRWALIMGAAYIIVTSGWFDLVGVAVGFYLPLAISLGGVIRSWVFQGEKSGVSS